MKTKVTKLDYEEVLRKHRVHRKPEKQGAFWRQLLYLLSIGECKAVNFTYTEEGMDGLGPDQPCLFLMNHSSFTDLQIAAKMLRNRQYHIICTNDGLVGKEWLMRKIGCIPTKKFITDLQLVRDMKTCVEELNSSILLFPEASYSFDGTATPLPDSLGKCVRLLKVPVVMIRTHGAFLRDPLYNGLKKRKVDVSAEVRCMITGEEAQRLSPAEINARLKDAFTFDHFREQQEAGIRVTEEFRTEGLERVLYRCPVCGAEGQMKGEGTTLTCHACGKTWELTELGTLEAADGSPVYSYVTDWYRYERDCVRKEILAGTYRLDLDVDIYMLADMKSIYQVGQGHLHHDIDGFVLEGCDGRLKYSQSVASSYSLYADYFWYEIGDMICIGDNEYQYYCFPRGGQDARAARTRLAAEELWNLNRTNR